LRAIIQQPLRLGAPPKHRRDMQRRHTCLVRNVDIRARAEQVVHPRDALVADGIVQGRLAEFVDRMHRARLREQAFYRLGIPAGDAVVQALPAP
jgi:hypothetical protein